jgi:hypothetical protein
MADEKPEKEEEKEDEEKKKEAKEEQDMQLCVPYLQYEETKHELEKGIGEIMPDILALFAPTADEDGRSQSSNLESVVLTMIKTHMLQKHPWWCIEIQKSRTFCDVVVNGICINLKLTEGKSADNSASKKGIFYSMTGLETYPATSTWDYFYKQLRQAKQHGRFKTVRYKPTEYHYLVIHKGSPGRVLLKAIFDIHTYRSNPSNDLQIQWNHEFAHADHATKDALYGEKVVSLLKTLQKSVKDKIATIEQFAEADFEAEFF